MTAGLAPGRFFSVTSERTAPHDADAAQEPTRPMRRVMAIALAVLLALLGAYAVLFYQNNRDVPPPDARSVSQSLERAIGWLDANRNTLVDDPNVILWWMVGQAAESTGDPRLVSLVQTYKERNFPPQRSDVWTLLYNPSGWVPVGSKYLEGQDYYQKFFIYALTCDSKLADIPDIAAQNNPDFCDRYPWKPACVTHQLLGFELLKRRGCGDQVALSSAVDKLQQRIRRELVLDPRVVDVYLQRVLLLVDTGASDLLKPVWIRRILDAQLADGGWPAIQPLLSLGNNFAFGFGDKGIKVSDIHASYHATAQGLLLMSLLDRQNRSSTAVGGRVKPEDQPRGAAIP